MGIKASRYDWIVVTEPTCKPVSDQWLKHLAVHFQEGTDIVLGYCGYTGGKGLFGKRVKADNLFQAMRYLGAALNRHPYMGIGQNLAYRKNVYNGHKGFADQLTLQRGDDDLFINALADSGNTAVALHPDSFMEQKVPPFKRIWFEDKVNRLVTGKFYHGAARFMNGLETWTCALFHLCTLIGLIMSIRYYEWMYTGIIAILWLLRFVLTMNNFRKTAKATGEKSCCFFLPSALGLTDQDTLLVPDESRFSTQMTRTGTKVQSLNNSKVNLQPMEVNLPFSFPMNIPASNRWVAIP